MATRCARDMSAYSEKIGFKITPLYAPNMFLSRSYTLEHAHNLKWRASKLFFATICFFWWRAMRTKATICCVSSSILLLAAASKHFKTRKRRKRTVWVKDWLLQRESKGAFNQIFVELRMGDPTSFQNYVRMNAETFEVSAKFRNNLFIQYFLGPLKIFRLFFLYFNLFELIQSVASL